ncbi:MAG: osmotically inducible protein OsmC [Desulfobulbus propionicus]|nr:MAG: osmotically inducible protein OsmC [Desulfobulbus propionicus]
MEQSIDVAFPSASQVSATVGRHVIISENPGAVDIPEYPSPFELFLASIVSCAASYARGFCLARKLSTAGLHLSMAYERTPDKPEIKWLELRLQLPEGFPEKYRAGILRAIDQCAVKKNILVPPAFKIVVG